LKVHQFHKGQTVQNLVQMGEFPPRTKWKVIDVIIRHKSREIKFEGGPVEFAGRVQLKLVIGAPDPFGKDKKPRQPFNVIEEKKNEDFPFSVIST
jgi:hypothetical protein